MAGLVQPVVGATIFASDLGSYYNLFKGISSSGDIITQFYKGANIASAAALQLGSDGNYWQVTGTTTITSISSAPAGTCVSLQFAGALTLTHGTTLRLDGAANYTTAANDIFTFISDGSGNWREVTRTTAAGSATPALGANGTFLNISGGAMRWGNTIDAGGLTITAGNVLGPNGSAAAPTYSFGSDTGTGIYRVGASGLGVSLGGVIKADFETTVVTIVPPVSVSSYIATTGGSATGNGIFAPTGTTLGLFANSLEILRIDGPNGLTDFRNSTTALGGGAAPTFGTIGGSGPGTAGQNAWLKVEIQGTATFIPVWR